MANEEVIAALLREKEGLEVKLALEEDEKKQAELKQGIKNVEASLKYEGYKAKPPAKAAEKSTAAKEKR